MAIQIRGEEPGLPEADDDVLDAVFERARLTPALAAAEKWTESPVSEAVE